MSIPWADQDEYLTYANNKKYHSLTMISREQADDPKFDKCFLVYPDKPLPGSASLPTTAFLKCGAEPELRVKMI